MTEQLPFKLIKDYGNFQLREYPDYLLAQVQIQGDFVTAGNSAFNPLLRYITGANELHTQLQMTAPVMQTSVEPDLHLVSFVLPAGVDPNNVPVPTDRKVQVIHVPGHLAVAREFTGMWSFDKFLNQAQKLEEAVQAAVNSKTLEGEMVGEPYFARYNSPFTPWFLRKNEAIVAFSPAAVSAKS
jgi:hypothetical protein